MNRENSGRSLDLVFLAVGFFVLLILGIRTVSSSDIWFHLAAGRLAVQEGAATIDPFSFALPDNTPWLQTNWLYDIVVLHLWRIGGSALAVLVHALAVVGAFLLLIPVCRKFSSTLHQSIAMILCAWLLAPLFTMRPLLFSLFFIGLFINLLTRPKLTFTSIALLAITQIVWANMHASFALGIIFAALRAVEARTTSRIDPASTKPIIYFALTLALAGLSLINPFGPSLFDQVLTMIKRPDGGVFLEWISPFQRDFLPVPISYLTTTALVLIAAVFIFHRERLPMIPTAAAVLSAFLLVRSNHVLELCAVLSFPFLTLSLASLEALMKKSAPALRKSYAVAAIYICMTIILAGSVWVIITNRYYVYSGSASAFGFRVNTDAFPFAAIDVLSKQKDLPLRIINIAHDGGFLLWRMPQRQVFTDPRGNLYGGLFYDRLAKGLIGQEEHWHKLLADHDPDAFLISAIWTGAGTMAFRLLQGDQWAMVYFDGTTMLIARTTSNNAGLLEDNEMRERGLTLIEDSRERYERNLNNRFVRPPNPSRLIGASSVYQALGHFEKSLPLLKLLTEGTPRMAGAWVNRGIAEIQEEHYKDAIATLTHAVSILPANALAWLWLGKAHEFSGNTTQAAVCRDRARVINRTIADLFEKEQNVSDIHATP